VCISVRLLEGPTYLLVNLYLHLPFTTFYVRFTTRLVILFFGYRLSNFCSFLWHDLFSHYKDKDIAYHVRVINSIFPCVWDICRKAVAVQNILVAKNRILRMFVARQSLLTKSGPAFSVNRSRYSSLFQKSSWSWQTLSADDRRFTRYRHLYRQAHRSTPTPAAAAVTAPNCSFRTGIFWRSPTAKGDGGRGGHERTISQVYYRWSCWRNGVERSAERFKRIKSDGVRWRQRRAYSCDVSFHLLIWAVSELKKYFLDNTSVAKYTTITCHFSFRYNSRTSC